MVWGCGYFFVLSQIEIFSFDFLLLCYSQLALRKSVSFNPWFPPFLEFYQIIFSLLKKTWSLFKWFNIQLRIFLHNCFSPMTLSLRVINFKFGTRKSFCVILSLICVSPYNISVFDLWYQLCKNESMIIVMSNGQPNYLDILVEVLHCWSISNRFSKC